MLRFRPLLAALAALLLPALAAAQTVPSVGDPATFDVATWNVEWFGCSSNGPSNETLQQGNVEAAIADGGIDVWALQEVSTQTAFDGLLSDLGAEWDGVLTSSGDYSSGCDQRLGFIWRVSAFSGTPTVRVISELSGSSFDFASRIPVELTGTLAVPGATGVEVRLVNLHAKCCGDNSSHGRRVNAAQALKGYVDDLLSDSDATNDRVVILGDYNDNLEGTIASGRTTSPYFVFMADEADYEPVSFVLESDSPPRYTFCSFSDDCSSGSNLDQIITTEALVPVYLANSTDRFDELLSVFGDPNNSSNSDGFDNTTSDHLPVYARFDFTQATPAEDGPLARSLQLTTFPSPFRDGATVRFTLDAPGEVTVAVYDALGRRVALLAEGPRAAGPHALPLDGSDLAPGVYLVRVTTPAGSVVRPISRF